MPQLLHSKERSFGYGRGFDLELSTPVESRVRACITKKNSKRIVTVFTRKLKKQVSYTFLFCGYIAPTVERIRQRWPTSYLNPVPFRKTIPRFSVMFARDCNHRGRSLFFAVILSNQHWNRPFSVHGCGRFPGDIRANR